MIRRAATLVGLLAWLALMPWPGPHALGVSASAIDPPTCAELEVVFVVDQSGSMPGSEDHPKANDPHGLRFFAPLRVVRWMGQDFVGASGLRIPSRPVITYHLGLVDFGSSAAKRLEWTTIAPATERDWRSQDGDLSKSLAPYTGDKGNTNFLAAFKAARDLFAQRSSQDANGCPRRAVFVLSDGMPYVQPAEGEYFSITQHMKDIKSLVQGDLADVGVEVWVTAINDSNDNYWPRMEPFWLDILPADLPDRQPHAKLVNTEDEIGDRFMQLMVELTNRSVSPVSIGPRCVPPFLQEIVLTFYKRDPSEHLDVEDPAGKLTPSRSDVEVEVIGYDEPIESLRIRRPLPGLWQINTTAPRADVIIDEVTLPAVGQLIEPVEQPRWQYVQDPIVIQITDSQGNALPDYGDPEFRLSIAGEAISPSGPMPLSFTSIGQQSYAAQFIPIEPGPHQVIIGASSRRPRERVIPEDANCQLEPFDVLKDEALGQFEVTPVRMVRLGPAVVQSATQEGCPLQVGDEAFVGYQTQSEDDHQPLVLSLPVEWETALVGPSASSDVRVKGPVAGQGIYTASMAFGEAGPHELQVIAKVRHPDGTAVKLLDDRDGTFDVAPIRQLKAVVRLLEPDSRPWWWTLLDRFGLVPSAPHKQIARDPQWKWLAAGAEVVVSLDGQSPTDPESILVADQNAGGFPVQLTVSRRGGKDPRPVGLVDTQAEGKYYAELIDLEMGTYELHVEQASGYSAGCGYALPVPAMATLERVENPWIYGECLVAALLLLLIAIIILIIICRKRNPCKGVITVLDPEKVRPIGNWYRSLGGRNRWRLRGRRAPPAETEITEIRVRSTTGRCGRGRYERERLWVQIQLISLTGIPELPQERILQPNEPWIPDRLEGRIIAHGSEINELQREVKKRLEGRGG